MGDTDAALVGHGERSSPARGGRASCGRRSGGEQAGCPKEAALAGAGHAAHAWHSPCSRARLPTAAWQSSWPRDQGRKVPLGPAWHRGAALSSSHRPCPGPGAAGWDRGAKLRHRAMPAAGTERERGGINSSKTQTEKKEVKKERKVGERERGGKGVERSGELGWTEPHGRGRRHCPDAAASPPAPPPTSFRFPIESQISSIYNLSVTGN